MNNKKIFAGLATVALSASLAVAAAVPAAAANECLATAHGNYVEDHASTLQPAGSCKYHKIQGEWVISGVGGPYYYASSSKKDLIPWGTVYVGYTLPSSYQLRQYRFCSDLQSYACTYSSWLT